MIKNVSIQCTSELPDFEKYKTELSALILAKEGTLPGNRAFGLSPNVSDIGASAAANLIAIDLAEKVEKYIPEITIADVSVVDDDGMGKASIKILIERRV